MLCTAPPLWRQLLFLPAFLLKPLSGGRSVGISLSGVRANHSRVLRWMLPCPPAPPLCMQHLTGLYVLGAAAASLALGGAVRVITTSVGGAYLAWAYLRFVQTRNGVRWVPPLARPCAARCRASDSISRRLDWPVYASMRAQRGVAWQRRLPSPALPSWSDSG